MKLLTALFLMTPYVATAGTNGDENWGEMYWGP